MDEPKITTEEQKVEIVMDDMGNTIAKPLTAQVVTPEEALEIITHQQEEQTPKPQQEAALSPVEEKPKPVRDEKGHFVQGNKESEGLTNSGPKCEFCERPVEIINKINLYREYCRGKVDEHQHIPYLQELVSEDYLDITMSQLEDWRNSEKHKEQHAELNRAIGKLMNRQQLNLLQATLTDRYRGAMFQLSANHGMIEKSKQYQAGDANEPLAYNIHIVPKSQKQIEQEEGE